MTTIADRSAGQMQVHFSEDAPRRRRKWPVILVAAVVLAAAAGASVARLSGTGHHGQAIRTQVLTTRATSDTEPSLAAAYGSDPEKAFEALSARSDWILSHPTLSAVATVAADGSPEASLLASNVTYLVSRQAHQARDPRGYGGDIEYVRVTSESVPSLKGPARALLVVVSHYLPSALYSASGRYLQPADVAEGYLAVAVSLVRPAGGHWLVFQVQPLHPPGGPRSLETQP